ncbi:MAG: acyl-CoA dehydrogenase family protein [Deltaproteobacteria bacterium]|nr:acyl-CoA dehydrogenase family protein [Deltaproteobacteria bacterium]MBW2699141.1 acyl-CoA dehydrogenase family protein [Deltaproteobacteria bacterium]
MSLDMAFDDGQQAIADALAQFCADRCDDDTVKALAGQAPGPLWRELAELGVLAAGAPGEEGGALEVCAAMEALGAAVFPGPLVGTFLALQVLPAEERDAIADGRCIVSAGRGPLMPFAPQADLFLEIAGESVYRATPTGPVEAVETLGGEPWGRVALERGELLPHAERGLALSEMAAAAYLAAAGARLVADAAEHARTRQQFGHPIGEFQAVAHPLADCQIHLLASRELARSAAYDFDCSDHSDCSDYSSENEIPKFQNAALIARLSARASAVEATHVCHQVFGALGITTEGPAWHVSRRIRQLASQPPGPEVARERILGAIGLGLT